MTFKRMGLLPEILKAVDAQGYIKATPIQVHAIPAILDGRDILGGAQTGTGKTAAFALPILTILNENRHTSKARKPKALILAPTRELADQVGESFRNYGVFLPLETVTIYGGVKINPQISNLKNGTDIVVATPGRLLDHLGQKTIDLSEIEIFVLDEADRMLDTGFIRDIKKIVQALPKRRQNLLFSATYGNDIKALAKDILKNPVSVEVTKRNAAADKVDQFVYFTTKNQKRHLLAHLIQEESWYQVLVFVKTKHGANRLAAQLDKGGIPSSAIHGNKSQAARTRALNAFKKGDIQALVATDIAARGIDLQDLSHVVNYDLPNVPEDYVHRIGRTGRAGKSGIAISLVTPEDKQHLQRIQRVLKHTIPVETNSTFKPVVQHPHPISSYPEHTNTEKTAEKTQQKAQPTYRTGAPHRQKNNQRNNQKNNAPQRRRRRSA